MINIERIRGQLASFQKQRPIAQAKLEQAKSELAKIEGAEALCKKWLDELETEAMDAATKANQEAIEKARPTASESKPAEE